MKSNKFGWKFEEYKSGDVDGLNVGEVETFKDTPLDSLAKESAQNSLDAKADGNKPVTLEFNSFYIDQEDFPNIEDYREMIDLQIKFWGVTQNDSSTVKFFREARDIINRKKIFCLRISDFNTTGLEGSRDGKGNILSNWWKLVRSKGVSDNSQLKGGSFGIGKHASFACSKLRTTFYSTLDLEGIQSHQGVSILATYDTKEGIRTRGKGYYCKLNDFSCIEGPLSLDQEFNRDGPGTDIFIIGLIEDENDLKNKIIPSILRSFLLAIYNGNLVFKINGETIDKYSLGDLIEGYKNSTINILDYSDIIEDYDILSENLEIKTYNYTMFEENDITLKLSLMPRLKKRIGIYRGNGMKIFDKKNLRLTSDFAGSLFLKGDKVNGYFRNLENPQHNNWSPNRADNPKEATKRINNLHDFIKDSLRDLENKIMPESENMGGISLLDEDIEEEGIKPIEGVDFIPVKPRESKTIKGSRKKIKRSVKPKPPVPNPLPPAERPAPEGEIVEKIDPIKNIPIFPEKIKLFQDNTGEYNLIYNFSEEFNSANCKIFIDGEQTNENVEIDKASIYENNKKNNLQFKNNKIILGNIVKNSNNHLKFKLKEKGMWALEVQFYDNQ
jgi:hypothetical protein